MFKDQKAIVLAVVRPDFVPLYTKKPLELEQSMGPKP